MTKNELKALSDDEKSRYESLLACSDQIYARLDRLQFVNPLVLEDNAKVAIDSIRRLLEYERFLDRLEGIKRSEGFLPTRVEEQVGLSMQDALRDMRTLVSASLTFANEFERVGALGQLVPAVGGCLAEGKEIESDLLLADGRPLIEGFLTERGMPSELWQWALGYVDLSGITISYTGGRIVARNGDKVVGLTEHNPSVLPIFDAPTFMEERLYQYYRPNPNAIVDGIRLASPYGRIINALKYLIETYEQRASTTALHGLQILPTGVLIGVVILLVLVAIVIVAGIVGLLCEFGVIKPHTVVCQIAPYVFVIGLVAACIAALIVVGSCTVQFENGELQEPDDPVG